MLNKLFFYIVTAIICISCGTPRIVTEQQRDSVVIQIRDSVILRDSLVLVPVPEGTDKARLPDTDTSRLETSIAESVAYFSNGELHHTLRNKSEAIIPVRIKIFERLHTQEKGLIRNIRTVERVEVEKELSKWESFLVVLGYITLATVAAWLALKLIRH